MDLISSLAGQLGLDPRTAQAVAGAVLGATREQVPEEETARLDEAVPEISEWSSIADAVLAEKEDDDGGGGLLGTLTRMAGSGVGNELVGAVLGEQAQETATMVALFEKLGLQSSHATLAAPVVLDFLEDRVGDEWAERIVKGAPMLLGLMRSQLGGEEGGASTNWSSLMGKLLG